MVVGQCRVCVLWAIGSSPDKYKAGKSSDTQETAKRTADCNTNDGLLVKSSHIILARLGGRTRGSGHSDDIVLYPSSRGDRRGRRSRLKDLSDGCSVASLAACIIVWAAAVAAIIAVRDPKAMCRVILYRPLLV